MDSFIRDTLMSMRRTRDSDFYSDQPSLISTSTKKFTTTGTPDALVTSPVDCDLPTQAGNVGLPFKVTAFLDEEGDPKFTVAKGSIQNGTNGNAFALPADFFTNAYDASAGYVVIEATVKPDLTIDDTTWSLSVQALENTDEVRLTTTSPVQQEAIRLVLAKITMDETTATVWQAQFTSVRAAHGFLNGVLVLGFEAAPTHPSVV